MPAAVDKFPVPSSLLANPADDALSVDSTLSDTVDQVNVCRGFRVGSTAGDVKITTKKGTTLVIPNVQIGETVSQRVTRFWATGTTATGITSYF